MDAKVEALIRKHLGEKSLPPNKTIKVSKTAKRAVAQPTLPAHHPRPSHPARQAITKSVEAPQPEAKGSSFPIDLDVLKQAIQTVAYGVGPADRPVLNAVFVEGHPGVLAATCMNEYGLAHAEFECDLPPERNLAIPTRFWEELTLLHSPAKITNHIESPYGDLDFIIKDNAGNSVSIQYHVKHRALDWRQVVPRDYTTPSIFSIQANRLVRLIQPIKRESGHLRTPVAFTFKTDGQLDIGDDHSQTSQSVASIPYTKSPYNKETTVRIGLDKKLLLRTLKEYKSESVTLKFTDELSAVLIELTSDPSSRFDVIMPMRLSTWGQR